MDPKQRRALESELKKLQEKYNKDIVEYFGDDLYKPWFEFLRTAYVSDDADVQSRLKKSRRYYAPWGDVTAITFDEWIGGMDRFFAEQEVRTLRPGQPPNYTGSIVIEVPLNKPETLLLRDIHTVFQMEHVKRQLAGAAKAHKRPQSKYRPTTPEKHKFKDLLKMLGAYRAKVAVQKESPELDGLKLLEAVKAYYRSHKLEIPRELEIKTSDENAVGRPAHHRAQRQLNRYFTTARKVLLNTAEGRFPGKH